MESFRKPLEAARYVDKIEHTPEVEAKIEHVCELMRACKFQTGNTAKLLAAEWGLSLPYVTRLTCEASRRVRSESMDPDHAGAVVGTYLENALRLALERNDLRVIAQLCQVYVGASGMAGPSVVEIHDAATPAKARELVKQLFRGDAGPKTPEDK